MIYDNISSRHSICRKRNIHVYTIIRPLITEGSAMDWRYDKNLLRLFAVLFCWRMNTFLFLYYVIVIIDKVDTIDTFNRGIMNVSNLPLIKYVLLECNFNQLIKKYFRIVCHYIIYLSISHMIQLYLILRQLFSLRYIFIYFIFPVFICILTRCPGDTCTLCSWKGFYCVSDQPALWKSQ